MITNEFPYIYFKHRYKGQDLRMLEISFSERFLSLIGYPIDSFVSAVLKEGIPQ